MVLKVELKYMVCFFIKKYNLHMISIKNVFLSIMSLSMQRSWLSINSMLFFSRCPPHIKSHPKRMKNIVVQIIERKAFFMEIICKLYFSMKKHTIYFGSTLRTIIQWEWEREGEERLRKRYNRSWTNSGPIKDEEIKWERESKRERKGQKPSARPPTSASSGKAGATLECVNVLPSPH